MDKIKHFDTLKDKITCSRIRERNAYINYEKVQSFEEGYRQAIEEIQNLKE